MTRQILLPILSIILATMIAALIGCRAAKKNSGTIVATTSSYAADFHTTTEDYCHEEPCLDEIEMARPMSSRNELPSELWNLSLDEAIELALQNTDILRSLGATVIQNPTAAPGSFDPAIQSSNPNFGIEAALSQFDANVSSTALYAKNDNVFNNPVLGGNATEVRDDIFTGNFGLNKITAAGTRFNLNTQLIHSQTDNTNALFSHSWTTVWEATARQPLLQGRGVRFNSIAGPAVTPGLRNSTGVVISRLNQDISIAQFERNVIAMVSEIVGAYWQLSLAHQNFDAVKEVRDEGLKTWNIAKARYDNDLRGGEADREAQAREQLFELQGRLLAAINGDRQIGQVGILQAEADLRRLLNFPQSDGRLIVPTDNPANVESLFNWRDLATIALDCRVEIREQRIRIKQRTLQLEAARNFTLPRLDAIATYRNNGFGDDLAFGGGGRFASALGDAISNDHGEWEVGLAYDVPIGFRQAYAGVKNSELELCREKAVLREQKKQILHELGSSFRQVEQNYENIRLQSNRLEAARNTVDARTVAYEADAVGFDELLQAQLRLLDSQLVYFRAISNYEISKADLLNESGQLLAEHGVVLADECDCD